MSPHKRLKMDWEAWFNSKLSNIQHTHHILFSSYLKDFDLPVFIPSSSEKHSNPFKDNIEKVKIPQYINPRNSNPTPDFLLYDLNVPKTSISTNLLKRVHSHSTNPQDQLAILLGVSGAGKTRALYESLCKEYGILFDCSNTFETPSPDLNEVVERTEPNDRDEASLHFERVICSRLLLLYSIFKLADENNLSFTPLRWLVF
eukprot:gb/GECH01012459.1/.p1 GENE.gb/GECH01012459.1/~~gb/GECH01012459.1/.p1  ORF type:complete len:202 (+),score=36.21 gb/GECH01012459.1/:1-606(+)